MSAEKSYLELMKECARLHGEIRARSIRITLISFSKMKDKSKRIKQLETELYKELSKTVRNNFLLEEIMEEIWDISPPPTEAFKEADKN